MKGLPMLIAILIPQLLVYGLFIWAVLSGLTILGVVVAVVLMLMVVFMSVWATPYLRWLRLLP